MRALILALLLVAPAAVGAQWGGSAVNGAGLFSPGVCLTLRNSDGSTSLQFCPQSATPGASASTAWVDYDGSSFMQFNVPTGDGFRWYAAGSALMTLSSTGTITSEAAAGANAFLCAAQAKCVCVNGSCTAYMYENASGETAFFVAGGERLRVTGGTVKGGGYEATTASTGFSLGDPGGSGSRISGGSGSPEASKTDRVGSIYFRTDGDEDTAAYLKTSGTGNTGWRQIPTTINGTFTVDFASIGTNDCGTSTQTVTGAEVGSPCAVGNPWATTVKLSLDCSVQTADQVIFRACNPTGGSIDPASASFSVAVFNP